MKRLLVVAAVILLSFTALAQRQYTVVAQRGGANLGNENTLSCITAGLASGADMVEVDVHMSKDGELIVCHDPTIDRTTDGYGKIEDMTAEEIRSFHVIDSVTGELTEETLPTLHEVMDLVYCEGAVMIEIKKKKDQYPGIEQKVVDLIRTFSAEKWAVVQCQNDSVLEEIHSIAPDIHLQKITLLPFGYSKCDFVDAVNVYSTFAIKGILKKIRASGKQVGIWPVDDPSKLAKFSDIDIVITDSPNLF